MFHYFCNNKICFTIYETNNSVSLLQLHYFTDKIFGNKYPIQQPKKNIPIYAWLGLNSENNIPF